MVKQFPLLVNTMSKYGSYPNSVSEAALVLDQEFPGWAHKINLSKLDMFNCEHCILGQLTGEKFCSSMIVDWFGRIGNLFAGYDNEWVVEISRRTAN